MKRPEKTLIALIAIITYIYFCVTYVPAQEVHQGSVSVLETATPATRPAGVESNLEREPLDGSAANHAILNPPQGASELFGNSEQVKDESAQRVPPRDRFFRRRFERQPRSVLSVGGANGINAGLGQGLRFGPPNAGVQYGGGEGVRFGTPNFGVKYGGGEGVRYGTPNIGVQYGGGQILRWGTPNAGVRIGGGEGIRIGHTDFGLQIGTGFGLQIGRIKK